MIEQQDSLLGQDNSKWMSTLILPHSEMFAFLDILTKNDIIVQRGPLIQDIILFTNLN